MSTPSPSLRLPLCALAMGFALAVPIGVPITTPINAQERTEAPNTDNCPHSLLPPLPRTTSEQVAPGEESPTPPPPTAEGFCGFSAVEGYVLPKGILASSFLVADIDTGEIIAAKDPHGRYRPASIIKGLLALVAVDKLDLKKVHVASAESASQIGSAVGIGPGGEYTIRDLLNGLLMASGNDAAHALAQELGGDEEALKQINELAHSLGATDTVAASYSGLDRPGMTTSAYDMGLIYQKVYANPVLAEIMNTTDVDFPGFGDAEGFELWNDNKLLLNDPDAIGGKTGFTDDANHTFVGALDRNGRRLMAVILDTTSTEEARPWQQAQQLLHAAYQINPKAEPIGVLEGLKEEEPASLTQPPTPRDASSDKKSADKTAHKTSSATSPLESHALSVAVVATVVLLVGAAVFGSLRERR